MDWTRVGVQWGGEDSLDRLAAKRAWLLGVGTEIEGGDDELRQLIALKRAEVRRMPLASVFAKVFQWLRVTTQSIRSNSTSSRKGRSRWGASSSPGRTWA